jgi:hypothetical protein
VKKSSSYIGRAKALERRYKNNTYLESEKERKLEDKRI